MSVQQSRPSSHMQGAEARISAQQQQQIQRGQAPPQYRSIAPRGRGHGPQNLPRMVSAQHPQFAQARAMGPRGQNFMVGYVILISQGPG